MQKIWCDEYHRTGDADQATRVCGYQGKDIKSFGIRTKENPKCARYLAKLDVDPAKPKPKKPKNELPVAKAVRFRLGEMQKSFCLYYAQGYTGPQAAMEAGYPEDEAVKNSRRILRNPEAQAYLKTLGVEAFKQAALTVATWHKRVEELRQIAMEDENYKLVAHLLEMQGKALGVFVDKKQLVGADGEDIQFNVTFVTKEKKSLEEMLHDKQQQQRRKELDASTIEIEPIKG
jgi:phage terminase small subunit